MYASLVLYALMVLVSIFSVKKKKNLIKQLGFREIRLFETLKSSFFYLSALIAASIILSILFNSLGLAEDLSKVPEVIKSVGIENILAVVVVGAFAEEIFFRGFLQKKTNLLAASFIFAYFHIIYGSLSEVIGTFFLGIILGIAFIRTKSLFVPVIAHLFYNLIMISIIYGIA